MYLYATDYVPTGVYSTSFSPIVIPQKSDRTIYGATIIKAVYEGSNINSSFKNAFSYACKLWEEQIPTAFPLNITVKKRAFNDHTTLAIVNPYYTPLINGAERATLKRWSQYHLDMRTDAEDFATMPDAEIIFNSRIPFSYELEANNAPENKYDFVTVAIQAIAKALGFYFQGNLEGEKLVSYNSNFFTRQVILQVGTNYASAINSGNVLISSNGNSWPLFFRPSFSPAVTFSYFSNDLSNQETAFMQPGITKGSAIRYIGSSMKDVFSLMNWDWPIMTSAEQNGITFETCNTGDVIDYAGSINSSPALRPLFASEEEDYFASRSIWRASGNYVLLNDGRWQSFMSLNQLNPADTSYARSTDGYLRMAFVSYSDGPGGNYQNCHVAYRLYKFPPQKPVFAVNKYKRYELSGSRSARMPAGSPQENEEEIYMEVEIGLENIEGCKNVIIEQIDSDWPIPYYYFANPREGKFTAYLTKRYPSTFTVTYINDEGETSAEPKVIDLSGVSLPSTPVDLYIFPGNNSIIHEVTDEHNLPVDSLVNWQYIITDAQNPHIRMQGAITHSSGSIDVSTLPNSIYSIGINTGDTIFTKKWVKE